MDLRRLMTFKAVVEEGSFIQASRRLYCTQSTITFQIQQLEQELGVKLFEKIGRKMVLTDSAKHILPHVYELTRVVDNIRQATQQDENDPVGDLRVVIGESLLSYKMPEVLRRFRIAAPKVKLSLQSLNCYVIRDALLSDKADLGVFYRVGNDESLHLENFGDEPLALVVSPLFDPADFTKHNQHIETSFIINEPQCIFRQIFETTIRQRQITLDNTIELGSIESIKQCVASNLGISYLPRFTVERELESGQLKELPFAEQPLTINRLCAYHAGKCVSPAMKIFIQCMHDCQ